MNPFTKTRRVAFGLMLSVGLLVASTVPVAGETVLNNCSGTCGDWQVSDMGPTGPKGAVCKYEKTSFDLDFISVRPPIMHGPFAQKTKVQWQYKILRSTNSGSSWGTEYTSTWQTAMANTTDAAYAGSGFARRYHYVAENPTGFRKVRVYLRWKNAAGSNIGTAAAEYDWYQRMWNGQSQADMEYCIQDW
jgi:hypothetical protein